MNEASERANEWIQKLIHLFCSFIFCLHFLFHSFLLDADAFPTIHLSVSINNFRWTMKEKRDTKRNKRRMNTITMMTKNGLYTSHTKRKKSRVLQSVIKKYALWVFSSVFIYFSAKFIDEIDGGGGDVHLLPLTFNHLFWMVRISIMTMKNRALCSEIALWMYVWWDCAGMFVSHVLYIWLKPPHRSCVCELST